MSEILPLLTDDVSELIRKAVEAVLSFWDEGSGLFLRDSREDLPGGPSASSPTSTARCVQALVDYVYFADVEPEPAGSDLRRRCVDHLTKFVDKHSTPEDVQDWVDGGANGPNPFTRQHTATAFALLSSLSRRLNKPDLAPKSAVLEALVADLSLDPNLTPFSQVAASRAVSALRAAECGHDQALNLPLPLDEETLESNVAVQLGFLRAGATWRFDLMALVCAATLLSTQQQSLTPNPIGRAALTGMTELQREDGTWPFARAVSLKGGRALYVSSHEISLTLVNACLNGDRLRLEERVDLLAPLLVTLNRAARLAEVSFQEIEHQSKSGWANEQLQGEGVIESWTTAVVTQFLIRLILLRHRVDSDQAELHLKDMGCTVKDRPALRPRGAWSDIEILARAPVPTQFEFVSDPTQAGVLAATIQEELIDPIAQSWSHRPPGQGRGVASLLVPGPPGSRKTSLLKAVASALDWPLVTVTPSVFLRSGLEGFEQRSDEVFAELASLKRAVVFFDECEELIRTRHVDGTVTQGSIRTMAAFTTAGMLTRLQELRDASWLVFAFATNADNKELDEAARRLGRFDVELRMDYPSHLARKRYVQWKLLKAADATASDARALFAAAAGPDIGKLARLIADRTRKDEKGDAPGKVSFSVLDAILENASEKWHSERDEGATPTSTSEAVAQRLMNSTGPRDLLEQE